MRLHAAEILRLMQHAVWRSSGSGNPSTAFVQYPTSATCPSRPTHRFLPPYSSPSLFRKAKNLTQTTPSLVCLGPYVVWHTVSPFRPLSPSYSPNPHIPQSCAVDPGGVRTSIWDKVPALAVPPARWVIETLFAPPDDGAKTVVEAATRHWEKVGARGRMRHASAGMYGRVE